jgi:hypothetical protein
MIELSRLLYGSHLYGTNTATSDFDYKVIVLPSIDDLLLGHRLQVRKRKFDADGNSISEEVPMPPGGWEEEIIPVQKFVNDFMTGQAYAVEIAFAQGMKDRLEMGFSETAFTGLCHLLCTVFVHRNVSGMVGFAIKQTFDYVRRGERYNNAVQTIASIEELEQAFKTTGLAVRLCTQLAAVQAMKHEPGTVMDRIAAMTGLELGTSTNQNTVMRTLKLNGREYLETTTLENFKTAVVKLRDQYGERSTKAASTDVDWKSLSHAVRVYEQVIELLRTKKITFPRENADELRRIKSGKVALEEVTTKLRILDDLVTWELQLTELPEPGVLGDNLEALFLSWLRERYGLSASTRVLSV